MELDREYLQHLILAWYARAETWSPKSRTGPYSQGTRTAAEVDRGRAARAAIRDSALGPMLCAVCDVWDVHLTDLGRRAGMDGARIGSIVAQSNPTSAESSAIRTALEKILEGKIG